MSACAACGQSGVSLKKCARCQMVAYCSVDCQRSAWPSHKAVCGSLTDVSSSSSSSSAGAPRFSSVSEAQAAGFRVQPSPNQISSDPQMADLQRQLLSKIVGEQMAAAGGSEAMEKDPVAFKRMMQQRVAAQMAAAGISPQALPQVLGAGAAGSSNAAGASQMRRRGGTGPAPKNPFTGEEVDRNLGKHEMPFGMPGTYYGPGEDEEDDMQGDHGHSHGGNGGHNHSHGDGGADGHNHSHGGAGGGHNHSHGAGADGHNHSHGGADGHNHSHGGAAGEDGHNHSHGGAGAGHNHSHGDSGADGHNHSHGGDGADGHNHGAHNHGGHNHAGHNHGALTGEDGQLLEAGADGHNHSHGGADGHNHGHGGADGHNHSHGGDADGHNHSHGDAGADGHNHSHGGKDGHNHSHGGDADGHNHSHGGAAGADGHNHSHGAGADGHNHSHGGADGHNHSHGGAAGEDGHNHSHGGDGADGHNHSHGGGKGGHNHRGGRGGTGGRGGHDHGHGGQGGGHDHGAGAGGDIDASNQRFGSKDRTQMPARGSGQVATEDSPAAQAAQQYTPPSLAVLDDESVRAALTELAPALAVGPVSLDTKAASALQLVYSSVSTKRPTLPGLPPAASSFTFLPLQPAASLDVTEQDLAERTGECHMCIMALQPLATKTPSREDIAMKQALFRNHVQVGRNLEKQFEEKEIVASNAPMSGAPMEVSQESLAPDCSIEMHSFQTDLSYFNPLDKQHSCAAPAASAAASASAAPVAPVQLDAARIQALQQALALGPSKATQKKAAKAKAKKEAAKAAAAAASSSAAASGGGLLSSITSLFTGGSGASAAQQKAQAEAAAAAAAEEAEEDAAADAEEAALLAAADKDADENDEEDSSAAAGGIAAAAGFVTGSGAASGNKKKKNKKKTGSANGNGDAANVTVIQVLVRCAPPTSMEKGFETALQDRDPLKFYRFEFVLPTPAAPPATPASASTPLTSPVLLAAYQTSLDFVLAFLKRTHPVPEPTAHQRANFTVKDAQGNLRRAEMPQRVFPAHLALWTDRVEWTGIPRTPFSARKLPGQTVDNPVDALVPANSAKINHNVYFTPANKVVDYQTSKALALAEQQASTALLASLWKSHALKELNLHVFPQGHSIYLYKSFANIEAEVEARRQYFQRTKFRPKKLFQNDRLDIQLQFEPTAEEMAQMELQQQRKAQGLPPLDNTPKVQLEEDVVEQEDVHIPVQRFLVL